MKGFTVYDFPFGFIKIEYEDDKVTLIKRMKEITDRGYPIELTDRVFSEIMEYLSGRRKRFDIPYRLNGTEFQIKVWKALCNIPYGETRSYKEIAEIVGNPKAARAVGMANNKNPLSIIVPCHRVVGSNGKLVGYAAGLDMKERLLEIERRFKNIQT